MSRFGFLECFDRYEGVGWVAKGWASAALETQNASVDLLLIIDGQPVEEFSASIMRQDLLAAGLDNARAFEVFLPEFVADGIEREFGVVFRSTNEHLDNSPQRFRAPQFRGRIERISGLVVDGWAFDMVERERRVVLELLIDDSTEELVVANELRLDLASALGTSGFNAFRVRLPSRICDGRSHRIGLRVANTDFLLDYKDTQFESSHEVVPDILLEREIKLKISEKQTEDLRASLLKIPINEIADSQSYAKWIRAHEAAWPRIGKKYIGGQSNPFFSFLPDPEWNESIHPKHGFSSATAEWCEYSSSSGGLHEAVLEAKGQYLIFPSYNGFPHTEALTILRNYLEKHQPAVLYTDDDVLDGGERHSPRFKPTWDYERFLGVDYIGRAITIRRDVALAAFQQGIMVCTPDDLIIGSLLSLKDDEVERLPLVLFHTAGVPPIVDPSIRREWLSLWLKRKSNDVSLLQSGMVLKVSRKVPEPNPEVAIIIPTRDRVSLLKNCIESIFNKTNYKNYCVYVVNNGSILEETFEYFDIIKDRFGVTVITYEGEFNYSKINNYAVKHIESPLVCLMNNDIVVDGGDWLNEMVSHAVRSDVGAVGAKLLFPDGLLQHGGVVVGFHGAADNAHRGVSREHHGYGYALTVTQRVSAVTAACLVCRREVYEAVGGLDEVSFPVSFNDVDFCLRLRKMGYYIIWTPYAELFHHESVSRRVPGDISVLKREIVEVENIVNRWQTKNFDDPYYSPNLNRSGLSTHSAFATMDCYE